MTTQRTIGGKFNSIGDGPTQKDNAALMVKLCGEIGSDGYRLLERDDQLFIDDCKFKMNMAGNIMFGHKQVEKMVAVHKYVMMRRAQENAKRDGTLSGPGRA